MKAMCIQRERLKELAISVLENSSVSVKIECGLSNITMKQNTSYKTLVITIDNPSYQTYIKISCIIENLDIALNSLEKVIENLNYLNNSHNLEYTLLA